MGKRIQGKIILIVIGLSLLFGIGYVILWQNGVWLCEWKDKTISYDIDDNGAEETFVLNNRSMKICREDNVIWKSDTTWKVADFLICDINGDMCDEVLLLVWKRGNYGRYTPFWDENDNLFSQHIFIFNWAEERLDPIWMSSELRPKIDSWDLIEDNKIHIITDLGEDTVWMWGTWGLERIR